MAKGLWRGEILYAKQILDRYVRAQLMTMITWYVGVRTQFTRNPGKFGKHLQSYLEPELWEMLTATYSDACYETTWDALLTMCELFSKLANVVAEHFGFDHPHEDQARVSAHFRHVRTLPTEATEIY